MVTRPMRPKREQDPLACKPAFPAFLTSSSFVMASLFAMLLTVGFGSNMAHAQGAVRSVHGEWEIRCDTPPGAPSEQCALMQYVTAADRDNVGLTVIILKTADKSARILRVLTPLGVLLPHGLGLKVDATDVGRAGFVRCLPQGCIAEVIMDDKLIELLNTGQTATFIVFQTPEEGIGIPIPLNGFKAGFGELK
ncbi:invasion-associated locus B family protein [Cohaesibacter celericrescens]|uniref:Invasion-associated locus B family protein n=2 Tax=Cohaesibacter celericrescens TaxID=2067669 RepID=A0A2N5XKB5_9HYPH|nr:invasion-associated locus B family protein [Cohaesibacter celericrescens]